MYDEVMRDILPKIDSSGLVADYGGANGLLKKYIPDSVSVDIDASKRPDICEDILTHCGRYDLVILRYVLHYLSDRQVRDVLRKIKNNGTKEVLVIQFYNNDLSTKKFNSINESKVFRNRAQLVSLLPDHERLLEKRYYVSKKFYAERLGNMNARAHYEWIYAALVRFGK